MRAHFISSVIFTVVMTIKTTINNESTRMILIVPEIVLFYLTLVLFAIEYDKQGMKKWKKREKKLVEETYARFFKENK